MEKHHRCGTLLFLLLAFVMAGGIQAQSVATDISSLTRELVALEDQWTEAFMKHDPAPLAPIIAEEYMAVGNDGRIWTKARMMDRVQEKDFTIHSFIIMDPMARRHGDTAVLYGMAIDKGIEAGKEYSHVLRFQDVWINRGPSSPTSPASGNSWSRPAKNSRESTLTTAPSSGNSRFRPSAG